MQQNYFMWSKCWHKHASVTAGCLGYSLLALSLDFRHALLIWDRCPIASSSSLLKGLWSEACSHPGCTLDFTVWGIRNRIRKLVFRLCFASSSTLHSRSSGQVLTERSTDQYKSINSSLKKSQEKWAFPTLLTGLLELCIVRAEEHLSVSFCIHFQHSSCSGGPNVTASQVKH